MSEISKYEGPGANLSKRDELPDRVFSAEGSHWGPVLLDLAGSSIEGKVTVGDYEFPSVRVSTRSTLSEALEAVRKTRIELSDSILTVRVPKFQVPPTVIQGAYGRTVVSGNASVIQVGGNTTIISGSSGGVENNIQVEVVLPKNSGVQADIGSGSLKVNGDLVGIDMELSSGKVSVNGSVGKARIDMSSGSFGISRVTEGIEATASSGSLNIGDYTGSHAKLRLSSGSLNLSVGQAATGSINVRLSSGSANIGGVRGRSDLEIKTKKSASGSINFY